ncbi:hypothetical protein [Nocardia sp. NPDC050710]|uniref:hypothetical protein n=1 Tax=Nocardia sp. NPDC050710 TaxID=3157220 RepID=UPI0033F323DD
MTSDGGQAQEPVPHQVLADAVRQMKRYFTDQGWSHPTAQVELAVDLIETLYRYVTDAVEHEGRSESFDLNRHFDLSCSLTSIAQEQQRLYWLLERWAKDCAAEGTFDAMAAVWAEHRFHDAGTHVAALAAALAEAHGYIGSCCDRSCGHQ